MPDPSIEPSSSQIKRCPQCGTMLPADAPEAPCSVCLMRLGLESWASRRADPANTPTEASGDPFEVPTIEELQPHFPQFELVRLLGRGGMGAVYLATQKTLDRSVAVKIIHPKAAADASFAERFAREARSLARLNHPNIVGVHDFGKVAISDGSATRTLYFIVMEYVEGVNLRELSKEKRLAPSETLRMIPPICDALQYAHDTGVVHRDIKPENILINKQGRVKIADFGLAKLVGGTKPDVALTGTLQAMGTPHYMAPEQMERPADVDHRADIYALGVTLYELLTGVLPLGRFAPPSSKVQIDVRLDEIVLRALEREPQRRYQHVSEVKVDVELLASQPVQSIRHNDADFAAERSARDVAFLIFGSIIVFATKYVVLDDVRVWIPLYPTVGVVLMAVMASVRRMPAASRRLVLGSLLAIAAALIIVMPWAVDQLHEPLQLGEPGTDEPVMLRVALGLLAAWILAELLSVGRTAVDADRSNRDQVHHEASALQKAAATWQALPRPLRTSVRVIIGFGFFLCAIQFLSFGATRRPDIFAFHLGMPDRWFSLEVNASGYQWNLNLATSLLLGVVALALAELEGWLSKLEGAKTYSSGWIVVLFGFVLSLSSGIALLGLGLTISSTSTGSDELNILWRSIWLMGVIEATGLATVVGATIGIYQKSKPILGAGDPNFEPGAAGSAVAGAIGSAGSTSKLLAIAISLLFGSVVALIGLGMMVAGVFTHGGMGWGLISGGGGTLLGGLAAVFGTWRNYRLFRGLTDPLASGHWNFADAVFLSVAAVGTASTIYGVTIWSPEQLELAMTLVSLGSVVGIAGIALSLWRWATRRSAVALDPNQLDLRLLLIAGGMGLGSVCIVAGVGAIMVLMTSGLNGGAETLAAWMGGITGLLGGGIGVLFGSWNAYRQIEGTGDIWESTEVTWFEYFNVLWAALGLVIFLWSVFGLADSAPSVRWSIALVGLFAAGASATVFVVRGLTIRGGRRDTAATEKLST